MKKNFFIITALVIIYQLSNIAASGQAPEAMSYQAILRDGDNNLLINQTVGMQISILLGLVDGSPVYIETQTPTTNANGLVSIVIGGDDAIVSSGAFSAIEWSGSMYFIKTETDPNGGANYTISGTSQLLSVPYAMHARTADSTLGKITETQTISDVAALGNSLNTQLKNVTDPTEAQDAATKSYVDELKNQIEELQTISFGLTDIEGNHYKTIKIGTQIWMAENLKTTIYNDGTAIPIVTDSASWSNLTTPGYCWYNNDSNAYAQTYGALYNWHTVETGNLCPTGWHVPSKDEWSILIGYLGATNNIAHKLKEAGIMHWASPNSEATNETGFTALPGGTNSYVSFFSGINQKNSSRLCLGVKRKV